MFSYFLHRGNQFFSGKPCEVWKMLLIFARSINGIDYPGDIPARGKPSPTLPKILKELPIGSFFHWEYFFIKIP